MVAERRPTRRGAPRPRLVPYTVTFELTAPNGDGPCGAMAAYVADQAGTANGTGEIRNGSRRPVSELERACLEAAEGDQRGTLLRYVHEMERTGLSERQIIATLKDLVAEMPVYDARKPWYPARGSRPDAHLRGLLHAPGAVIPDATEEEMAGEFAPLTSGLVESFSDVEDEIIEWLWPGYVAFRKLTQLDGEKGQGKSSVVDDVAARASRGRPMPGQAEAVSDPVDVIIFTSEDNTKMKLMASGANLRRVKRPKITFTETKRGGKKATQELLLPSGASLFGKMIREAGASLAIWDPITDFLDEDVKTANDASVRRALKPLGAELDRLGCAGIAIRHMNKDTSVRAKYRGGGTTAFQNRARVHLVTGELPKGYEAEYGLSIVASNLVKVEHETLAYSIEDSDIKLDNLGNYVGRVAWKDFVNVDADTLTRGEPVRRGPAPTVRNEMADAIEQMFDDRDVWPSAEALAELEKAGFKVSDSDTVTAAKNAAHVRSIREAEGWVWRRVMKDSVGKRGAR